MDVDEREKLPEKVIWLARYPDNEVKRFKRYVLNELKFRIKDSEANRKTQNSEVSVATEGGITYYGVLTDIIELNYLRSYDMYYSNVNGLIWIVEGDIRQTSLVSYLSIFQD